MHHHSEHNHSKASQAVAKKNSRIHHVWWLPFIALLMVIYFSANYFIDKGPLITIQFTDAEGLSVNKTKVKYKDVIIGKVEAIELNDDLAGVIVSVRMNKDSDHLLRKNTRFWIEKPRISITKISGLNTLLSGNFIAIEPDNNKESESAAQFIGLEAPPIVLQNDLGLTVTLSTEKASAIHPGTPVYFKGIQVGSVNRVYFSADFSSVKADAFVNSPYDQLIKKQTRFWNTNGVSIDLTDLGLDVSLESLEAVLFGGISFATPAQLGEVEDAIDGQQYVLYENKKSTQYKKVENPRYFVSYFSGGVKGLSEGSPIRIKGMKIGEVKDIMLIYDHQSVEAKVPVLMSIDESQLKMLDKNTANNQVPDLSIIERLIQKGLHAQMETDSLITGAKYIALTMPKNPLQNRGDLIKDKYTDYVLLPSLEDTFDSLLTGVDKILEKINQLPLDELMGNVNGLILSAENKVNEMDIRNTVNQLNKLLKSYQNLPGSVEKTLSSVNRSVVTLAKELSTVMSGLSPDAPLYFNLNQTVESLNDTLNSIQSVSDLLESKPEALIFGKESEEILYE